ncbi:MAG: BamA/TamA family outer membrane protein [Pseudomonadota bacterium]
MRFRGFKSIGVLCLAALAGLLATPAWGNGGLVTEISGVDGELLANVRAHSSLYAAQRLDDVSVWRLRQLATDTRSEVRDALQPFGYYRPRIEVRLEPPEGGAPWRALINIDPGQATLIRGLNLRIQGEGMNDPELIAWQAAWPLTPESRLVHADFESAWQALARLAEQQGYFDAEFIERRIEVDPDRGIADIVLRFDTGDRYRFDGYRHDDQTFSDRLINRLSIIQPGEPYAAARVDEQREVLIRSGLFQRVVVEEARNEGQGTVALDYGLEARPPNAYRATVGFGTDTGARLQLGWTRHYLSSRGNRMDLGFGAQQQNSEFVLRGDYLHPRSDQPFDFWTAGFVLRREQDDFRFSDEDRIESVFESFDGRREQAELVLGRLEERIAPIRGLQPIEERLFVSFLDESFDALRAGNLSEENQALLAANPELEPYLQDETQTLALGANWQLFNVSGTGFFTQGQVIDARLLGASESLGSDVSFAQAYLGARWHQLFGDRHKLLLRAEAGYTEADVDELNLTLNDETLDLSITELPERYRFKTGGDRTVRGYAFEALSTNRNGGNHLLALSAEYEYRVGENWSLAAFYDIGNAFNDFDQIKLKRGIGAGFRFYTVIGPIQVDLAQALDDEDQPLRLHLTIGTRLL